MALARPPVRERHEPSRHALEAMGVLGLVSVALLIVALLAFNGSTAPRRVPVIGDSITFLAGRDISAALRGEYHADVHGGIGRRIDEMLPTLQTALDQHPFAVVVNLGTNDALQADTHPDWRTGFTKMIRMLARQRCVLVTTIGTELGDPSVTTGVATAINSAIATETVTHPNFHVVDWNAAVQRRGASTLLISDRVHPSAAGQLVLADLIRTALDRDCRS